MQKTFILSLLGLAFSFVFVFAPSISTITAQSKVCTGSDCAQQGLNDIGSAFPNGAQQERRVQDIVKMIIDWALYLAAIAAVIFIIIGGFLYITSAGNSSQAGQGKQTLINALIGLAMVVLSYIIVQIVYNFLVNK